MAGKDRAYYKHLTRQSNAGKGTTGYFLDYFLKTDRGVEESVKRKMKYLFLTRL